jgi:hypothetical protein
VYHADFAARARFADTIEVIEEVDVITPTTFNADFA